MAKSKDKTSEFSSQKVISKALEQVMQESMLPYSEFVIMDRALPRVEDGLKPVQRRVLYSMLEVGVLPDRPFRKSARIVGDCMGKYHPHGDRSIYDTMVRMAQPFNMGEVLVNGHGNFGSVDGDGAAAMRYTEAKLAPLSLELLRDIEKNTVSWSYNFDDSCKEPDMLPGRFPNLLVNGGSGIAVGLATNIPTHNLREACNLVGAYIDNPKMTVEEMLEIMPGPDFPTGGYLLSSSEVKNAYKTGKGKLILRAKLHIENGDNGKKSIVITEIPYQVNKATLLQKIAKLRESDETGVLGNIQEIVDESDRSGMRAVIKLKKEAKVNAIINALYKSTDLQTSFNVNMVAIADGKPKLLSLPEILEYYVNYQQKVIYNRTKYDLEVALKKEHILEGLLIAIQNIDEVVRIIKNSKNTTEAKITLMETFSLSDVQAQAILDMRLARLTSLEVNKLVTELNRLKDLIRRYTEILKSPRMQMKIVKKETLEIAKNYGSDRKCSFIDIDSDIPEEDSRVEEKEDEELHLVYTPLNTIKTVTTKSYNMSSKELSASPTLAEVPSISLKTHSSKQVYAFTNLGNCIKLDVSKINQARLKDRGANLSAYCKQLNIDETLVNIIEFDETQSDDTLIFVSSSGMIKTTKVGEYFASKQYIGATKLKENERLVYVDFNQSNTQLAIFTKAGLGVVVGKDDIAVSGRISLGVKGINLDAGDEVISSFQVSPHDVVALFAATGTAKALKVADIGVSGRNKKGTKLFKGDEKLLFADVVKENVNYVLENNTKNLDFVLHSKIAISTKTTAGKKVGKIENIVNVHKFMTDLQ